MRGELFEAPVRNIISGHSTMVLGDSKAVIAHLRLIAFFHSASEGKRTGVYGKRATIVHFLSQHGYGIDSRVYGIMPRSRLNAWQTQERGFLIPSDGYGW